MKLGVTYQAFSGLELLKPSILNIRPFASHITVVWSRIAFSGEPCAVWAEPLLHNLVKSNLIDELIEFHPKITKRPEEMQDGCRLMYDIGRCSCLQAGCTHSLLKDCDEFHDPVQLEQTLKNYSNVDCSLTLIREYVNNPTTRIKKLTDLYVPFLQKAEKKMKARNRPFKVLCDGGRTIEDVKTWRIYKEQELVMHHYTFVRYNDVEMHRKYCGNGHAQRMGGVENFLKWTKRFSSEELETVPDSFGILNYWNGEFQQWIS